MQVDRRTSSETRRSRRREDREEKRRKQRGRRQQIHSSGGTVAVWWMDGGQAAIICSATACVKRQQHKKKKSAMFWKQESVKILLLQPSPMLSMFSEDRFSFFLKMFYSQWCSHIQMCLLLCWWTVSAGASIKLTVAKTKHYHNVNNESSSDAGSGRMTKEPTGMKCCISSSSTVLLMLMLQSFYLKQSTECLYPLLAWSSQTLKPVGHRFAAEMKSFAEKETFAPDCSFKGLS